MLFNSYLFILLFFPAVLLGYFSLNHWRLSRSAIFFLFCASLFFYSYWNINYLPLILISILVNYAVGHFLLKKQSKYALFLGVIFNILLLGYYKYTHFFIVNLNTVLTQPIPIINIILPLGISFFTFTQIAFLVDAYHNKVAKINLLNYGLFVTYFPHLLAGPIIHHAEIMPQFLEKLNKQINYKNMVIGLLLFAMGLFKKACIADTFAEWVNNGYERIALLSTFESWLLSFCYTMQIYFDFSGYTDMAIGCSYMLNIKLPANFNSPYKALSIQDFWRRWHMTLSRWLRDYVYIPLGGNQHNEYRTYSNLMLTFLIGGFWHGAGWTYVIWGGLHGMAMVVHRLWQKLSIRMPMILAWFITFMFVNFAWVFFRADSTAQAISLIKKMFNLAAVDGVFTSYIPGNLDAHPVSFLLLFPILFGLCFVTKNSLEIKVDYAPTLRWNLFIASILTLGLLCLTRITTFIYFQF
jgi:alginate O-acetyltransferase complex protein AlgI